MVLQDAGALPVGEAFGHLLEEGLRLVGNLAQDLVLHRELTVEVCDLIHVGHIDGLRAAGQAVERIAGADDEHQQQRTDQRKDRAPGFPREGVAEEIRRSGPANDGRMGSFGIAQHTGRDVQPGEKTRLVAAGGLRRVKFRRVGADVFF